VTVSMPRDIRFGRDVCGDLRQAERREWWLTNGIGGYAGGTVAGTLTRRYHGLLVAPVDPPLGRVLVLARADAVLIDGTERIPLHTDRWADGTVSPQGHLHLETFHLDGRLPVWRHAFGARRLESRVWMEPGANTTYAAWRLDPEPLVERPARLEVRLLVNGRDHHFNTALGDLDPEVEADGDTLRVRLAGRYVLTLRAVGGTIEPDRTWYRDYRLAAETERGLPDLDNHLSVGIAGLPLVPGQPVGIVASLEPDPPADLSAALERRRGADRAVLARAGEHYPDYAGAPSWVAQLLLAADDFLFVRPLPGGGAGVSVMAGYPWFGDWGRDTMIALPGLTLATGRTDAARAVLETYAGFVDGGMLPNFFPGAGDSPVYNSVDAALWYVEAWRAYVEATGDDEALARAFPVLQDIVDGYRRGTRHGIRMNLADGLLQAGSEGQQLTWMDGKVGDRVITARHGKPVEINALWHNALAAMADLARRVGRPPEPFEALAAAARAGFARFVNPYAGALFDVVDGAAGNDPTVRPNQILAVSLPHSPLAPEVQAAVVRQCGERLLCSYGLRSLAPGNPAYRGGYEGGPEDRDSAYHQGPAWAWLLGHFAIAEYRVHGDAALALSRLEPVADHLRDAGLGTVGEIFDGRVPHRARGCPAQAWSVACVLEAWWRLDRAARGRGRG